MDILLLISYQTCNAEYFLLGSKMNWNRNVFYPSQDLKWLITLSEVFRLSSELIDCPNHDYSYLLFTQVTNKYQYFIKPQFKFANYRNGYICSHFHAFFVMHATVGNLWVANMSMKIFISYQIRPNQSTSSLGFFGRKCRDYRITSQLLLAKWSLRINWPKNMSLWRSTVPGIKSLDCIFRGVSFVT